MASILQDKPLLEAARCAVPALAALTALLAAALRVRRAPPRSGRLGPLDKWRLALAVFACAWRGGAEAWGLSPPSITGAAATLACGVVALAEARRGLHESWFTRVAWHAVAGSSVGEAYAAGGWPAFAAAGATVAAALSYGLFNAGARRSLKSRQATADYALLDDEEEVLEESPEDAAGPASTGVFAWMSPLLAKGYARPLEASDLFPLIEADDPDAVAGRLRRNLEPRGPGRLLGALVAAFGPHFFVGGVYKLIYDSTQLLVPVLLSQFLKVLGKGEDGEAYVARADLRLAAAPRAPRGYSVETSSRGDAAAPSRIARGGRTREGFKRRLDVRARLSTPAAGASWIVRGHDAADEGEER